MTVSRKPLHTSLPDLIRQSMLSRTSPWTTGSSPVVTVGAALHHSVGYQFADAWRHSGVKSPRRNLGRALGWYLHTQRCRRYLTFFFLFGATVNFCTN
jgi:hypothetical protein